MMLLWLCWLLMMMMTVWSIMVLEFIYFSSRIFCPWVYYSPSWLLPAGQYRPSLPVLWNFVPIFIFVGQFPVGWLTSGFPLLPDFLRFIRSQHPEVWNKCTSVRWMIIFFSLSAFFPIIMFGSLRDVFLVLFLFWPSALMVCRHWYWGIPLWQCFLV